jgi:hypothetical protein
MAMIRLQALVWNFGLSKSQGLKPYPDFCCGDIRTLPYTNTSLQDGLASNKRVLIFALIDFM